MKRVEGSRYNTMALIGSGRLVVRGDSLEETRREIDESNERAMKRGYKAESWIITHQEWYRWYDDEGNFVRSEQLEQAIEVYPTSK